MSSSRTLSFVGLVFLGLFLVEQLPGQNFKSPPVKMPEAATLKNIADQTAKLGQAISSLRKQGVPDQALADLEVYHQAAQWIVQHKEFYETIPKSGEWTLEALDRGLLRARLLSQGGQPWLLAAGHPVVRGYRSRIDGSVQPFAVTLPPSYFKDPFQKWRIDVVLHGRDTTLTEVKFLHNHNGEKAAPADQNFIKIDIFGRGNNAYRWAGETDVFEVLEAFIQMERNLGREGRLDHGRTVLRGFSMGGAGTWHLGLHWPDRWSVLGPGAGFTTTHGYAKLPAQLPTYQEACLHIYDAVDYAENAFNVPVVAYSGAKDPQKKAADNIEKRLKELGIPMTHLIAPDLEHKFPLEWQKKAEAIYAQHVARGRPEYPPRILFVTYTLRYPSMGWVEILGLERHYQKSLVDAAKTEAGYDIKTANVRALHLTMPDGFSLPLTIKIDGQELRARPWLTPALSYHVYLQKREGRWSSVLPQRLLTDRQWRPQKIHGLQGPIDDAFTDGFVCVTGTGQPWHQATQQYAEANLKRFQAEWAKYFRGHLPIKDDIDIANEDLSSKHLILFGDPSSNFLISQVLDGLPLQWTKEAIVFDGKKYPAGEHVPVLIFPNPLNPLRYVVLNSGHTFHAPEFQGTNALLFPRLGDYAILKLNNGGNDPLATEVATAGLFDEFWKLEKK